VTSFLIRYSTTTSVILLQPL